MNKNFAALISHRRARLAALNPADTAYHYMRDRLLAEMERFERMADMPTGPAAARQRVSLEASIMNHCRHQYGGSWVALSTAPGAFKIPARFPLLMQHDASRPIGAGRDHRLDRGTIYATFDITDAKIRDEVQRGLWPNVSVAFRVLRKTETTMRLPNNAVVGMALIHEWELREVSIVTYPMNPSVGFGRHGIVEPGTSIMLFKGINAGDQAMVSKAGGTIHVGRTKFT